MAPGKLGQKSGPGEPAHPLLPSYGWTANKNKAPGMLMHAELARAKQVVITLAPGGRNWHKLCRVPLTGHAMKTVKPGKGAAVSCQIMNHKMARTP